MRASSSESTSTKVCVGLIFCFFFCVFLFFLFSPLSCASETEAYSALETARTKFVCDLNLPGLWEPLTSALVYLPCLKGSRRERPPSSRCKWVCGMVLMRSLGCTMGEWKGMRLEGRHQAGSKQVSEEVATACLVRFEVGASERAVTTSPPTHLRSNVNRELTLQRSSAQRQRCSMRK